MGRVKTKTVKRAAKVLLERHYQKLTSDFHINKRILSEVAKVPTKKLRNKIAGFATHLVKRIQKGPVKGISLKVQEEERERRLDWVPKESEIKLDKVTIDAETQNMLRARYGEDFVAKLGERIEVKAVESAQKKDRRQNRKGGDRKDRAQRQPKAPREQGAEGAAQQEGTQEETQRQPKAPREQGAEGTRPPRADRKRGNRDGQE